MSLFWNWDLKNEFCRLYAKFIWAKQRRAWRKNRRNEFHPRFNLDHRVLMYLRPKELIDYITEVVANRIIAHEQTDI